MTDQTKKTPIIKLAQSEDELSAMERIAADPEASRAARVALASFNEDPIASWGDVVEQLAIDLEILAATVTNLPDDGAAVSSEAVGFAVYRAAQRMRATFAMIEAERARTQQADDATRSK